MHVITILYPQGDDTTFDMTYYTANHMPMFADALGDNCAGWGAASADGGEYHAVGWAMVKDMSAYKVSMAEHGAKIMGDVPNYTTSKPILITGTVAGGTN